jgi:hypothetical protein
MLDYIKETHPAKLSQFRQQMPSDNWSRITMRIKDLLKSRRESLFVFSTSELPSGAPPEEKLYMWGHYGNGHRGIAIEFDSSELLKAAKAEQPMNGPQYDNSWTKINYVVNYPPLTCEHFLEFIEYTNASRAGENQPTTTPKLREYNEAVFKIKSTAWERENERRLMCRYDGTRMKIHRLSVPAKAITTIFLGLNVSAKVQADMLFESKQKTPGAKILKARKKVGEFAVSFEPVVSDMP